MSVADLFKPLPLLRGPAMKNRFMLAPLTNQQSLPDGQATDDDVEWVRMCAEGGYSLMQTCAATIHETGRAFKGQLGIHDDSLLPGLTRMAGAIRAGGALSAVQLHHAGHRAQLGLGGIPAPASDASGTGFPALTTEGVEQMRDMFIAAALRAEKAGFDGVAVHGAFGWVLSEFLSPTLNTRKDKYGGSLENRSRLIFEVIKGIRSRCRPDFQIGLRLSIERYGLQVEELRDVAAVALEQADIDYLDMALWDSKQRVTVEDEKEQRTALSLFTELPRGGVRVGTAGKVMDAKRAGELLDEGCDFALIGRAAILRPDFPRQVFTNPAYASPATPVTSDYLRGLGLSSPLIMYLRTWPNFVV